MAVELVDEPEISENIFFPNLPATTAVLSAVQEPLTYRAFLWFLASARGGQILTKVRSQRYNKNNDEFRHIAAGRIFEELAGHYILDQRNHGQTALSLIGSNEIVDIYKTIFPQSIVNDAYGLLKSIIGVTLPDLMLIRESRRSFQVQSFYEVKLGVHEERFMKQMQMYRQENLKDIFIVCSHDKDLSMKIFHQAISQVHRGLRGSFKPLVFSPSSDFKCVIPSDLSVPFWGGSTIPLPITASEFGRVTGAILEDCLK